MGRFLTFLAPKGRLDLAIKVLVVLGLITWSNFAVASYFLRSNIDNDWYILLNALCVGGPWAALFFAASWHQFELLSRMTRLLRTDPVTGLPNRNSFFMETERRQLALQSGALVLISVRDLKSVTDQFGQAGADLSLVAVAQRLQETLRAGDMAGRIGTNEFAVYLADCDLALAGQIAARLAQPVDVSIAGRDEPVPVALQVLSVRTTTDKTIDELFKSADVDLPAPESFRTRRVVGGRL